MRMHLGKVLQTILALSLCACGKTGGNPPSAYGGTASEGGAPSEAGAPSVGGAAGHGYSGAASANGGSEAGAGGMPAECREDLPAVCCAPGKDLSCEGFEGGKCKSTGYCTPISGAPWRVGDGPPDRSNQESFVACQSLCGDNFGEETWFCILQEHDPGRCYVVSSQTKIPDGWIGFEECGGLPSGACFE